MDQTDTATGSRTNESFQPSEDGQKFDVFLSHSGKQKDFVRQLYKDLTSQGVSCFFDEDRESLPVAENFPPRIFEAAKTCKVAILLLSKDFLESKWPMLELCAFLEAKRTTNPNLKILPLFFRISPGDLKNTEENDKKWNRLEISREKQDEWHKALKTIRPINGLRFGEGGDEVKFRDEIVKEIWQMLPTPFPRYHVRGMQGEARMCQELAEFFNVVQPNKEGIRIAGLYGIAGRGKTTLGKAFCNLKLGDFEGKVCHLEFSRGNLFERIKLALQYLTHRPESVQTLTSHDQAQVEMYTRVKGQRVLLVLDNITEESIDEVLYYLKAELGENSWVLLSARSVDVLVKHFNIDSQSCMRVPRLEEEEAVAILLERAFLEESKITAEDRAFALRCAKRCLFKGTSCDIGPRAQSFHPLALKAFGGYLFNKCGSNLSKWVDQIDDMVGGSGDGLDEVFDVLCKAFDGMLPKYRTIFMLLTVYVLPNMSLHNVIEWMAINCNEEITFIEKAVQGLQKAAFIEEFKPEIRIHELYMEFAQRKAEEMGRWLCWKGNTDSTRGLIAQDKEGFELAKLEQCMYRRIGRKHLRNLCVLQLVHVDVTSMSKLDLGPMDSLRSITLRDCKDLEALDGMEKLVDLAWLQIRGVYRTLKLPDLSSFQGLQYLEIHITGSEVFHQLGDLSHCFNLREINVDCPSLLEFPRLKGMQHLKKVEFSSCDKVKGPLDCTGCVELQIIVLNHCCQMAASPLLSGCKKLSKLVLWECDAVPACPDVDAPNALKTLELFISSEAASAPKYLDSFCLLENLQLWNMRELMELPSFERLSNLTVLKLANCGIRELPDLTGCDGLEDVYLFTLKNLERLPDFSLLRELKKLSLCNCTSLECPPHIVGCHKLQMLHLLYNDNMKGLSKMDKCAQLEEIQVSWHSKDEVSYGGNDSDSCQVNEDLEFCLEYWKDEKFGNIGDVSLPDALKELEWVKGKKMLVKRYFRGVKLYYSLTAPYCWISNEDGHSKRCTKNLITLKIIDSKVMTFPTRARDSRDRDWVHKVNGYFAATKTDNPLASASSVSSNIVKDISLVPPLSPRYPVPSIQGEARMCQVIANFFKTVNPNGKGIRIAGLYGMPGMGKTTLAKAFCNNCFSYFQCKVCHLEFYTGGNTIERLELVLHYLTQIPMPNLGSITKEDDVQLELSRGVKGQKVLLVLDNISEQNIEEVKYYLDMDYGENSCILLSTQKLHSLEKDFKIDSKSCMHVPTLLETEAIAILCERKPSEASAFSVQLENKDFSLQCAKICSFEDDRGFVQFHPLALKVFGRCLFRKGYNPFSNYAAAGSRDGSNDVFVVLNSVFHGMEYECQTIFMLLARGTPPHMSTKHTFQWLARKRNKEIEYIKKAVADLYDNAFIEEIEPVIRIHELWKEFAHNKGKYDRLAPQQKHHVPAMQGGARMCLELEDFFYTVRPNIKGIRIAGLYGMVGQGKTSLCKTFCNLNLSIFDGKVCYLELSRGNRLDRLKIALQYLTHCNESQLDSMTGEYELSKMFRERLEGQRALLVLDNITEYSIREVMYYLRADLGENSYILLSGRSENVLANNFNINSESCMTVPCLEEEEAIAILLERTCLAESALGPENRGFALHCANKCSFKKTSRDIDRTVRKYHPLALKTFGRHLFFKHGADLSHWVAEADGLVFGSGDGLDDIFIVLEKAFDYMDPKNRTIFMLLTLYMQPIESPLNVNEWLAITCKEEIKYIKKAVEDLQQKGFIEEIKPEIRINDLYVEFAQSKPRWLWCKCDLVTSEAGEDETGVELVNAEYCQSQDMFMTGDRCVNNLIALKFVKLRLCLKECLRSISSYICEHAGVLGGMENSPYLALLNVGKVSDFKVFNLNILTALQYLEIDIRSRGEPTEVGDLTGCVSLREIYVCCDSLSKFPAINGLQRLEKASFKWCIKVIGPLDCSNCVMLQSIVFENCWQMAHIPLIVGCSNLSKIVLNGCKSIAEYSDEDESSALEMQELCISSEDASEPRHSGCCDGFKNQPLWNIVTRSRDVWSLRCLSNLTSRDVWSLRRLSNLTVLKLYKCDTDQPLDVTCCSMLEEVYFYKLKYLYSFPNFSSLRKLKILCLCYCKWVQAPPDIRGCEGLEVFHLLYNDDMKELPQMDGCPLLQEIKLSWPSKKAVPHRFNEEDDVEFCPDYQKDGTFENLNDVYMPVELKEWEWIQGKTVRVKKYSRERKEYYCMRAPYESEGESGRWEQASNADSLDPVTIPSAGAICQGFQQQV